MKPEENHRSRENIDRYRAAMDHLRLPEDFEQRTLELAKQHMECAKGKQASRDIWRAKPFYRRPAAQVCFVLLLFLVIGIFPVLHFTQPFLATRSNDSAAVTQYDGGENGALCGGVPSGPVSGEIERTDGTAEAANASEIPTENSASSANSPETASAPAAGAGIEEQAFLADPDEPAEKRSRNTIPGDGTMDTDTGLPSDESVPSPSQPQLFQENGAASAQSGQNTGEDSAQTPAPSALLRSAPENTYEEPGLPLVASDGEMLYFQPYPSQKNGGSLMVWDGTALSSTGISHADSLIAINGGYSYTIENKLYHGSSLVRDFSDEALLGTHAFSLRVFGSDSSYFYLYANAADSVSGEVSPYAILRVSLDGQAEQLLFGADGLSAGGRISQAILAENTVYYSLSAGNSGIYALDSAGGQPRQLSSMSVSGSFCYWNGELIFTDTGTNLCAMQSESGSNRQLVEGGVLSPPVVRGGTVYYNAMSPNAATGAIYAYDLAGGESRRLLEEQGTESGITGGFCQLLPASDGLFLVNASGDVFHYHIQTGILTEIT